MLKGARKEPGESRLHARRATNQSYAAYADAVIAALSAGVEGGQVIERAGFVANVRAWRENSAALEAALQERAGVSRAETSAFLNAQNRITGYVRRFMDASDWFADTPVPADLRAYVDTVLKPRFGALAEEMKDNLNLWPPGEGLDLEQTQLYQTIDAFAGAMSAIGERADAYRDVMGTLVHATSRVAIGFVPYVGPALDLCEAITGKAWCLPSGQELSDEERIFSGLGFAIAGSVPLIGRGMKNAGLSPSATRVAGELEEIEEAFAAFLRANRRKTYKTLTGAITSKHVNEFEKKAAEFLVDQGRSLLAVGDDGVRRVLGIPFDAPNDLAKAPDFISVIGGNKLCLSEAKGLVSDEGLIDVFKARRQLQNAMNKVVEKRLAGDVTRVEIIIPRGAKLPYPFGIKDGYLFHKENRKTVHMKDFPLLFIRVVEL
jgi:hypothetical protein